MSKTVEMSKTTSELDEDLVKYVRTNREPLAISEAAEDLACLGRFGAAWPRKSKTYWAGELRRLVREGKLAMHDGGRVYPPEPAEAPRLPALAPEALGLAYACDEDQSEDVL